jgi:DNA-binding CsgD family transcriptional regulator
MAAARSWPGLRGRESECARLSALVSAAQAGTSQALVLRGEAGIGKTALLEFLVDRADSCQIARAAGVESEMELAHAGLHQLCGPHLDRLSHLPVPQRNALGTAFGLQPGIAPGRFLLGLAVLTLLSEVAEEQPLVCVVDDAQWLDRASLQALEFVGRRLGAERVAMVFAVRETDTAPLLPDLPSLALRGLDSADAAALLESAVPGPLDPRVRDRVLAEAQGNPLALLELPRGLTATELAFGGTPRRGRGAPLANRLQQGFAHQLRPLPASARLLLLVAASEPAADVVLVWRAAERLGIGSDAAAAAEASGLIELGDQVRFRHPLVRSAAYRSATPAQRRAVHRALADVTDPDRDPDRRAWHRARATMGTDEDVAAELERAADRAASSGGATAAAAFLETAAGLTPDPGRRARRALVAGQAKATIGAFEEASSLLASAEAGPLDDPGRARADLLRAQIAYNSTHRDEAVPLFVAAARRLEPLDAGLARETYLDALSAAVFAGRLGSAPPSSLRAVAQAARAAPPPDRPGKADLLLQGMAELYTEGYRAGAPVLRRAVEAFGRDELSLDEGVHSSAMAVVAAVDLWDDEHWDLLSRRHLDAVRAAGAVSLLPLALSARAVFAVRSGTLGAAASLIAEGQWVAEVTGGKPPMTSLPGAWLAAMKGDEQQAELLIRITMDDALVRHQGATVDMTLVARAVLAHGLGRYGDALVAARQAAGDAGEPGRTAWPLSELVEAAVRTGNLSVARAAFDRLSAATRAGGSDWGLGVEATAGALLGEDRDAEELYREAIERLARTRMRVDLGRAQLLYGEWLRRQGRRADARAQLRTAHEALAGMGVDAFAERARRELLATGETVRKRTLETTNDLTAQETHIARLAAEGLTNPEIAAQLYISPRTVEWHLRKVFTKVGVSTRRQLRRSLPDVRTA